MKIFVHTKNLERAGQSVIAEVTDSTNLFKRPTTLQPKSILKAVDVAAKKARKIKNAGGNPILKLKSRISVNAED